MQETAGGFICGGKCNFAAQLDRVSPSLLAVVKMFVDQAAASEHICAHQYFKPN